MSPSAYLAKLKFLPELTKTLPYRFLGNFRLIILLVVAIVFTGIFGLLNLPRRINPDVEIPYIFVSTVFPGASPETVENQVTIPLEEAIDNLENVKTVQSGSQTNVSSIFIEFTADIPNAEAAAAVQTAVDSVGTLPADAQKPVVTPLDFEDVPVITFALVSQHDLASLMAFAADLQDDLEAIPEIQKVTVSGLESPEIEILIRPETYATYRLTPFAVSEAVSAALASYPVGSVQTSRANLSFTVEPTTSDLAGLRDLPVRIGQDTLTLGKIADISLRSAPGQYQSFFADPQTPAARSVTFSVYKTVGADLEKAALAARQTAQAAVEAQNSNFRLLILMDFATDIADQFQTLIGDFLTSLFLIFITLLVFLGIRQALIASLVIPLSFLATFAFMYLTDIQLSFLSIFSLLLGLGMIVDDAIVMISAMTDYYRGGKFTPLQTATLVWRDFFTPTLSSNLTNIWSFLPLLIAAGLIGEFTKVISYVVTIALVVSTVIALVVTLPFMVMVLGARMKSRVIKLVKIIVILGVIALTLFTQKSNPLLPAILLVLAAAFWLVHLTGDRLLEQVKTLCRRLNCRPLAAYRLDQKLRTGFFSLKKPIGVYKAFLKKTLASRPAKKKIVLAIVALSMFSYVLVPLGLVKNEFFPKTDQDNLYISLELPVGTLASTTRDQALELLPDIVSTPGVDYALLDLGAQVDMGLASLTGSSHLARFSLKLREDRDASSLAIAQALRQQFNSYTAGELQVVEVSGGPPAGADLEITLLGEETGRLQTYAETVRQYLKSRPEVINVTTSTTAGLSQLTFVPDPHRLLETGFSSAEVALLLRTYLSGFQINTLENTTFCPDPCPIQLRFYHETPSPEDLGSLLFFNQQGSSATLPSLGELTLKENPTQITRLDGQRSISVSAGVLPQFNRVALGRELTAFVDGELDLPKGYRWQTGGINEEYQASVASILQAMILAAILILGTMVIELKSFRQAIIVMLAIPLAVSGVFILFGLLGIPLSFPALVGVLALFGIVVKNSIMIVDKINRNLAIGLPRHEAIADGASSRLEPIIFSSVTNIIGLIPITLSDPLWQGLGGAIIAGLTLSGAIMLFFIPVIYDLWIKNGTGATVK